MHRADDAGQRFAERSRIEALALVGQQAALQHHLFGDDDVGGVAAGVAVGVSGCAEHAHRAAFIRDGGLDGELVPGLEGILPFPADFDDLAGEFVSDDGRMLGYVLGNALVVRSLVRRLVGRHANAVADHLGEDLPFRNLREFEFLQPQVVFSVQSDCSCLHISVLFL